jgi:hypothetical protein
MFLKELKYNTLKGWTILCFIILSFLSGSLISQESANYPVITYKDLPDAVFSEPRKFIGASLFGYIDGGAELYLEYGFSEARINQIEVGGRSYKTEIYKMNGIEEAFGIFSVSRYRCLSFPSVADFSCQTKYQLQFCKGPYYISIINRTGTKEDSATMLTIGKIIADKIPFPGIDLSVYFPGIKIETLRQNAFLAKGRLGIVNGDPDLEDFFSGVRGYTAVMLRPDEKTLISIWFPDNEQYNKFIELHHWKLSEDNSIIISSNQNEIISKAGDNRLIIELRD